MSKITIIIPCYNEAGRLPTEGIISFLKQHSNINLWLVNDGSKDETARRIDAIARELPEQVQTLHLHENLGKAEAIRQGMLQASVQSDSDWFGYWDADLATPLDEIQHLMYHAKEPYRLLLCSRIKRLGARIHRHAWRHFAGRVMATLISWVLRLPVYDTQCGAKLISPQEIKDVFSEKFLTAWLFDVEIIARLQTKYNNDIQNILLEVPIYQWEDIPGSKLRVSHMFFALIGIIRIYLKYGRGRHF
ncbi:MAG: glycosyltransferase [Chitinivibrionales bacterium]|nr:glycosyltransferase [Chitinivibrionales bacterium]